MKSRRLRWIVLIACLFFVQTMQAQQNYRVSGVVLDGYDNSPLIKARVDLQAVDDAARAFLTVTNDSGEYHFDNLAAGEYQLKISYIGYQDYIATYRVGNDMLLPQVVLQEDAQMLDEVQIMASYSTKRKDGSTNVLVQNNPLANGKDMGHFLRSISDVQIEDDALRIHGQEGSLIYLNDQKISYDELKRIPTSMIARIEIQPYAEARYGTEAKGGILRVYLKDEGGLLGSITLQETDDRHGFVNNQASAMTIFNKGRFGIDNRIYGDAGGRNTTKYKRKYITSDGITTNDETEITDRTKGFGDNLNLKYYLDNQNRQEQVNVYGGFNVKLPRINQFDIADSDLSQITSDGRDVNYSAGAKLWKSLSKKHKDFYTEIKLEYYGESNRDHVNYVSESATNHTQQHLNNFTAQGMLHLGWDNDILELMLQTTSFNNKVDNSGIVSQTYSKATNSSLKNTMQGFVGSIEYRRFFFNKRLMTSLLLFPSYININVIDQLTNSENKRTEKGIYPAVTTVWNINPEIGRSLQASARFIYSLPAYNYFTDVPVYITTSLYSVGNPDLRKEKIDLVNVYYTLNNRWSFGYDFVHMGDIIVTKTDIDPDDDGVYFTKPYNDGINNRHDFSVTHSGKIFSFWHNNSTLTYRYTHRSNSEQKRICQRAIFTSYNQFNISKTCYFGLNIYAATKNNNYYATYGHRFNLDALMGATLLNNSLSLKIIAKNLLQRRPYYGQFGDGWRIDRDDYSDMPRVQLTATWNFNIGKKIQRHAIESVSGVERKKIE